MITKGVASVRSPVANLQAFNPAVTHESFTAAVIREFQREYGVEEQVRLETFLALVTRTGSGRTMRLRA